MAAGPTGLGLVTGKSRPIRVIACPDVTALADNRHFKTVTESHAPADVLAYGGTRITGRKVRPTGRRARTRLREMI